ncbi:MAG TPA: ABC transporter permease [Gemmatimonadales bacterium]|jgi:ABC-type polysaccharide/polyol phosphate export permease|nr:ABC transporter permease [Gemmatimonadales bacterium]
MTATPTPSARPGGDRPLLVASSSRRQSRLADIWRYREFLRTLVVRNLKVKYQRSMLGFIWTLLNPMLTIGVLTLVFTYFIKIKVEHYWAFVFSGYFVWNFMLQMLSSATYTLAEHASLRRSVAFPSEVLVLATAASRLVEFAVEMAIAVLLLIIAHHHGVPASLVLLPWLIAIQVLLAIGLAMPVATLSVFYSDVQHAMPILLLMLFYLSPVFYPATLVPETLRPFYFLNPIAGLLTLYHDVLYSGHWPTAPLLLGVSLAAFGSCALGYMIFNRYKVLFAEIV